MTTAALTPAQRDALAERTLHSMPHPPWCDGERVCWVDVEPDGQVLTYHRRRFPAVTVEERFDGSVAACPDYMDEMTSVADMLACAWDFVRAAALTWWLSRGPARH
ncbi:hypothetical protein [Actinomyces faecalis]|uniref:hypothetical protein n=1 Tax=Actinomyces faecalis TaxID=2722820 RepID=UPI00155568E6|nr:hypothetical protein [Actinomyces faecalis]